MPRPETVFAVASFAIAAVAVGLSVPALIKTIDNDCEETSALLSKLGDKIRGTFTSSATTITGDEAAALANRTGLFIPIVNEENVTFVANLEDVRGPRGPQGPNGINGLAGINGQNGLPGNNGTDGTNGTDGPVGPPCTNDNITSIAGELRVLGTINTMIVTVVRSCSTPLIYVHIPYFETTHTVGSGTYPLFIPDWPSEFVPATGSYYRPLVGYNSAVASGTNLFVGAVSVRRNGTVGVIEFLFPSPPTGPIESTWSGSGETTVRIYETVLSYRV